MNLHFTYESRDTQSRLLCLSLSRNYIWNTVITLKKNLKKLAIEVHVLQTKQNVVISRCCFAQDGKEMYVQRFITHVHSYCSAHYLNLLFSDVPVAVADVVFLSGLHTANLVGKLVLEDKKLANLFLHTSKSRQIPTHSNLQRGRLI